MAKKNEKRYSAEETQQELGPGTYMKYSDMTLWDKPGEGGPDLYFFIPAVTEDELMALEDAGATPTPTDEPPSEEQ